MSNVAEADASELEAPENRRVLLQLAGGLAELKAA
jgi:hypothetical protein